MISRKTKIPWRKTLENRSASFGRVTNKVTSELQAQQAKRVPRNKLETISTWATSPSLPFDASKITASASSACGKPSLIFAATTCDGRGARANPRSPEKRSRNGTWLVADLGASVARHTLKCQSVTLSASVPGQMARKHWSKPGLVTLSHFENPLPPEGKI